MKGHDHHTTRTLNQDILKSYSSVV